MEGNLKVLEDMKTDEDALVTELSELSDSNTRDRKEAGIPSE